MRDIEIVCEMDDGEYKVGNDVGYCWVYMGYS